MESRWKPHANKVLHGRRTSVVSSPSRKEMVRLTKNRERSETLSRLRTEKVLLCFADDDSLRWHVSRLTKTQPKLCLGIVSFPDSDYFLLRCKSGQSPYISYIHQQNLISVNSFHDLPN